jgi:drug/metabolite transporter (DMT)-like permease
MTLVAVQFSIMGMLVRMLILDHDVSVFWIGLVRFALGAAIVAAPGLLGAWPIKVHNKPLWVLRGVIGSSGVFCIYIAITYVGLGRGMVLAYLMGLFGALSGVFILREKLSAKIFGAVLLATVGVLLSCNADLPRGAEWFALAAALLSGTTLSLIRRLRRTDSNQMVVLSQGVFGTLILIVPAMMHDAPFTLAAWAMLLGASMIDIGGQFCMSHGLSLVPVARGAALMMLTPIFSLLLGTAFLDETLSPMQWFGCAMVLAASMIAIVVRNKPSQPQVMP